MNGGFLLRRYNAMLEDAGVIDKVQREALDAAVSAEEAREADALAEVPRIREAHNRALPWWQRVNPLSLHRW